MLKKKTIMKWTSFAAAALVFGACGTDPKNYSEDDDTKFRALFPDGDVDVSDKWLAFSAYLGIFNLQAESDAELLANITKRPRLYDYLSPTPPGEPETKTQTLYDEKSAEQRTYEVARFNAKLSEKLAASAATTQCAEVVGATTAFNGYALGDDGKPDVSLSLPEGQLPVKGSAIKFHYFRYKLVGDTAPRTALFVKPAVTPSANLPLVMYSHAVTGGIKYSEIASLLGKFQGAAFIAAPSFPGESVYCEDVENWAPEGSESTAVNCKDYADGVVAAPIGEVSGSTIYDKDADELHGLYSCLEKARKEPATVKPLAHGTFKEEEGDPISLFTAISTTAGQASVATSLGGSQMYTLLAGADRGAFTNQVAAGKAGAYIQAEDTLIKSVKEALKLASFTHLRPQGIISLGSQSSFSTGINLIALELMYKGALPNHNFNFIPTFSDLGGLFNKLSSELNVDALAGFDPAAEEQSEAVQAAFDKLAETAVEVAIRDLTFLGATIPVAVRDWNSGDPRAKGEIIWLHGTKDKLASFTQAAINTNTMAGVDKAFSDLTGAGYEFYPGGINYFVYGFQPKDEYLDADGELKASENPSKPELNHVSDPSFLTGNLTGLSAAHLALVAGSGTPSNDKQTLVTKVISPAIAAQLAASETDQAKKALAEAQYKAAANATLLPLLDSENRSGDQVVEGITPTSVAAMWFTHQAGKANQP